MGLVMVQNKKTNYSEIHTIHVKGVRKWMKTYAKTYNAINDISNLQKNNNNNIK